MMISERRRDERYDSVVVAIELERISNVSEIGLALGRGRRPRGRHRKHIPTGDGPSRTRRGRRESIVRER